MEVLGKCHAQLGPSLVDFLEGLKPAQLMALEEHFRQNPLTQARGGGGTQCACLPPALRCAVLAWLRLECVRRCPAPAARWLPGGWGALPALIYARATCHCP